MRTAVEALAFHKEVQAELASQLSKNPAVHGYVSAFFVKDRDPLKQFITNRSLDFERYLVQPAWTGSPANQIPRFTHKIWVTHPESPSSPTPELIDAYARMMNGMSRDWSHFLWTNNDAVGTLIRKELRIRGCDTTIIDVTALSSSALFPHIERLLADRKFALAADLLKMSVIDRMGGIYSDLGAIISPTAAEMFALSDIGLVASGGDLLFQMQCFALPPKSTVAAAFTGIAAMPESIQHSTKPTAIHEVCAFAGPNLTISTLCFSPDAAKTWIVPNQGKAMILFSYGSWCGYSKHSFGNADIRQSVPSIMQVERYEEYRSVVRDNLTVFGDIELLRPKLELLLKLIPHYTRYPTELCKLLAFRGSDKAMGWHNYSILYNFILSKYVGRNPNVLEIGIGTNFLDTPSTMGEKGIPGASLRAWRDYFINANVYGADVDKRILFQEPGITTNYVDQTKPETIKSLLSLISKEFDLIIDDGLHRFHANRNVVEATLPWLKDDGILVVEDVLKEQRHLWRDYLSQEKLNGAIVDLPHATNDKDNTLVFILPR